MNTYKIVCFQSEHGIWLFFEIWQYKLLKTCHNVYYKLFCWVFKSLLKNIFVGLPHDLFVFFVDLGFHVCLYFLYLYLETCLFLPSAPSIHCMGNWCEQCSIGKHLRICNYTRVCPDTEEQHIDLILINSSEHQTKYLHDNLTYAMVWVPFVATAGTISFNGGGCGWGVSESFGGGGCGCGWGLHPPPHPPLPPMHAGHPHPPTRPSTN